GLQAEVFTAPTALIMSFGAPTELKTRMMRLEGSELDLGKLEQVDAIADQVIDKKLSPRDGIDRLQAIFLAPPRFGHGISTMWHAVTPSLVTVAALIILLPGMSLTTAMSELATRHLIAGTARLMSAVIVLLELVVGVALGERAAAAAVEVHHAVPVPLPAWAP